MKFKNNNDKETKEDLISTLKNMVENKDLLIEFSEFQPNHYFSWNQDIVKKFDNSLISLPKIPENIVKNNSNLRASFDIAAAYILFHQRQNFHIINKSLDEQKIIFEFEKVRVISNLKDKFFGASQNILQKIEEDLSKQSANFEKEKISLILLKKIFEKKEWIENFDQKYPKITQISEFFESKIDKNIVKKISEIANKYQSQNDFLKEVEQIIDLLKTSKEAEKEGEDEKKPNENNENEQSKEENLENFGAENIENSELLDSKNKEQESAEKNLEEKEEKITQLNDFIEDDFGGEKQVNSTKNKYEYEGIEYKNPYKIYSSKFDEIIFPDKLITKEDLNILAMQLELKIKKLETISKKMSLKFKQKLLSKKSYISNLQSTAGILNKKKLPQLIADPKIEDIWINDENYQYQNTALTILLDNSGSMRGQPIVMTALACQIIAEILEKFSLKTEIIGFTTVDWKGGKVRKLWESEGKPKNPGRLNQLRHIIYKHFNQSFKRAKNNLGLMLKEGILKENIDGEALLFARSRLLQRGEKRKILIVISDGTPVDDSTSNSNDEDILNEHLHQVINKIEKEKKIEIIGVGIGHSTDQFYKNSVKITDLKDLGDAMIEKIISVI